MIVEDQLDRGAGRVGGVEKLEEFDELAAAVAVSDEGMDLSGEQIDPGQQAERAVALSRAAEAPPSCAARTAAAQARSHSCP